MKHSLTKLEQESRHADPARWKPAVERLANLAGHQRQAWQAWRSLLLSENQELKLRGLVGLEVLREDAPDLLEEVLLDQIEGERDPVFLGEVARLASSLPEGGQHAVFLALWSNNEPSRCAALRLLLDNLWPETGDALEAVYSDPSEEVRLSLVLELCDRIDRLDVWPQLARLAEDPSSAVRAALASSLVGREEAEALQLLAGFLSDSDAAVRAVASVSGQASVANRPNLLSAVLRWLPPAGSPEPPAFDSLETWLERPDRVECLALVAEFTPFARQRLAARLLGVLLDDDRPVLDRWLQSLGMLRQAPPGSPWQELKDALRFCVTIGERQSWQELVWARTQPLPSWPSLERLRGLLGEPAPNPEALRGLTAELETASLLERVLAAPLAEYCLDLSTPKFDLESST